MSVRLLASDLDGTLVGHDSALRRLNTALADRREAWKLAYVTGRTLSSALELLASTELLQPDVLVSGVGTEIHWGTELRPDPHWPSQFQADWHVARVRSIAATFAALIPQPESCQSEWKCSYFLDTASAPFVMQELQKVLTDSGMLVKLIYSSGRDLDIIPFAAGKGQAVRWVAEQLGVTLDQVVACGDSGNDLEMLQLAGYPVVVGHAQPELLRQAPASAYRAQAPCADGILEALVHFGHLPAGLDSSRVASSWS
ncbi:MAG: sucrose-phosphate phosphatase [Candidatus Sericytochromatia bacterium]|nr:sucrose-phosphate phosphatase [Candidatus Sericytochromatia bacterium]